MRFLTSALESKLTIRNSFNGYYLFLDDSWSTADFIVDYIAVVIFFLVWAGWKIVKKTKMVPLEQMDLDTGRRESEALAEEEGMVKESLGKKIMATSTFLSHILSA